MVDIKGLDKARVLKALYDYRHGKELSQAGMGITVEDCAMLLEKTTHFAYLNGRAMNVDLSGDEFDPRTYDLYCGEGAAQRAVDSIRDEPKGGEDATGTGDGEKKEPSLEERAKTVKEAVGKIVDILAELPPDECLATAMYLKAFVLTSAPPLGGMFAPIPSRLFMPSMRAFYGGPDLLGHIK